MPGLYLYPNSGAVVGGQFVTDPTPALNRAPRSVSGTAQDDQIVFGFDRFLYLNVHMWLEGLFAYGVKQRRVPARKTASGAVLPPLLLVETVRGGEMLRACWDMVDRRTGKVYQETATGVLSAEPTLSSGAEQWAVTLHRADYLLQGAELVAPSKAGCSG